MSLDKQAKLDEIKADIIKNNVGSELAATAKNLVFGDGDPNADIVFIGEAPGKNEDEQGLPFVGAAGKFLEEMLASINMNRQQVYITNIVKYRPPNNRDPFPEEKVEFLPYLERQLEVIDPLLVVTLGRHSMNCFLPDLQISKVHGQPKRIKMLRYNFSGWSGAQGVDALQGEGEKRSKQYEKYGERASEASTPQRATNASGVDGSAGKQASMTLVILPLFHPAAALYNGSMRQTLVDDFNAIPETLHLIRQSI